MRRLQRYGRMKSWKKEGFSGEASYVLITASTKSDRAILIVKMIIFTDRTKEIMVKMFLLTDIQKKAEYYNKIGRKKQLKKKSKETGYSYISCGSVALGSDNVLCSSGKPTDAEWDRSLHEWFYQLENTS